MSYRDPPSDILIVNQDRIIFRSGVGRLTRRPEISATLANMLTLFTQKIMKGDPIRYIRFQHHRMIFYASQKPEFPSLVAVVLVPLDASVIRVYPCMEIVLSLMEEFLSGKIEDATIPQLDCFNRVINFPSQSLFLLPKSVEGIRSALVLLAGFAHDIHVSLERVTSRMFFVMEHDFLTIEQILDKVENLGVLSVFPLPDHLKDSPNKFCEIGNESPLRQFFSALPGEKPFQALGRVFGAQSNAFKMSSLVDNDEALEVMQSVANLDKEYDVYVRNEILLATVMNPGKDVVSTLSTHLLAKMKEIAEKKKSQ